MLKKSLMFFSIVFLLGALVIGCSSPTGSSGEPNNEVDVEKNPDSNNTNNNTGGDNGQVGPLSGDVTAEALKKAFEEYPTLTITGGTIEGVVPNGKTLVIQPGTTTVKYESYLTVLGTLDVNAGAVLDASYSGAAGYLSKTESGRSVIGKGKVQGRGNIALPFLKANAGKVPTAVFTYQELINSTDVKPTAGSWVDEDISDISGVVTYGEDIGTGDIDDIFKELPADAKNLTLSNIAGLVPGDIASGNTLTLTGDGNTITAAFDLSLGGNLNIASGAVLTVSTGITITGAPGAANITVEGTLKLLTTATALTILGKVDLSKATIDASGAGVATLTLPTGDAKIAKISIGDNDLAITGATALIITDITSKNPEKGVKSGSVTKYFLSDTEYVGLATPADTFIVTDITGKVVSIATPSSVTIGSALTIAGTDTRLKTVGDGGISVTGLTGTGYLPLNKENLAKFAAPSKITFSDAATGIGETLVIPADISVTATNATLATITGLTVNGELTVGTPALTGITAATAITGTGKLTGGAVADGKALLLINSGLQNVSLATTTITGGFTVGTGKTRTFTGAAAPTGAIAVSGGTLVFSGAAAPTGDITVSSGSLVIDGAAVPAGAVTITGSGALVIADGKSLTIDTGKVLSIPGAASVTGGEGNGTGLIKASAGSITIAGKAGYTTETGGVAIDDLADAVDIIVLDSAKFVDSSSVNLTDFGGGSSGTGTAVLEAGTPATNVKNGASANIELSSDTLLAGTKTATDDNVTHADLKTATFTLSLTGTGSNEVSVTDSAWAASTQKKGVLTYTGVKLQNGALIGPALPDFNIGISTKRS